MRDLVTKPSPLAVVSFALILSAVLVWSGQRTALWAYGPIFSPHYQVPGSGIINLLSGIRNEGAHGLEFEQGIGFGINRSLGFNAMVPFQLSKKDRGSKLAEVDHVDLEMLWRIANFDRFASKRALVINLGDRITQRRDPITNDTSLSQFPSGSIGYLGDYLGWIMIADLRVDRSSETVTYSPTGEHTHGVSSEPPFAHRVVWIDSVYGWRFYRSPETASDAMWVFDSSFRMGDPRALWMGTELLYQPHATWLFKLGYRYPVAKIDATDEGGQWAYEMEYRF
jgi:hypothetical protein